MRSLTTALVVGLVSVASAQPAKAPAPEMPAVGDTLALYPDFWGKQKWLYDAPNANDAAGKVVIHWFCTAKLQACTDDLARVINLRDNGHVYIVAYLDGNPTLAKKLDPIRESEGIGRGTVATGTGVTKLMKLLAVKPGPSSIVVDVDGKVAMVSTNSDTNGLDARDAKVNALTSDIKAFTTSHEGPTASVKAGDKFSLTFKVQLASWLKFSSTTPKEFDVTVPKDFKCDATSLRGDQLKVDAKNLMTATITCTAPHGIYQAAGKIRFGYDNPGGGSGLGDDGAKWDVKVD